MKTKGRRVSTPALLGLPDQIIARQDRSMKMEQWMDHNYPGWVWDNSCDRFIAIDPDHAGPGVGYLVLDRNHRGATTVVLQHQIH
jgi:hypothetical protein